jgi:hypothetical protein
LGWIRDICRSNQVVIVRVTARYLATLLGKLCNPQKHDAIEKSFGGYINTYLTSYLKGLCSKIVSPTADTGTAEPTLINVPAGECYGDVSVDDDGRFRLYVFLKKQGPGNRAQACESIPLKHQAYTLLEAGLESARRRYFEEKAELASADGTPVDRSECDPPVEQTFRVGWTQDQLAAVLHNEDRFKDLNKGDKDAIKTAMSRLRNLAKFTQDNCGLISEPDANDVRWAVIPLRFSKSR